MKKVREKKVNLRRTTKCSKIVKKVKEKTNKKHKKLKNYSGKRETLHEKK